MIQVCRLKRQGLASKHYLSEENMTLIQHLSNISENRRPEEVAAECDIVFTDDINKFPGIFAIDSFKAALDKVRKDSVTAMAVFDTYFIKIEPNARWMRALRLYQETKNL